MIILNIKYTRQENIKGISEISKQIRSEILFPMELNKMIKEYDIDGSIFAATLPQTAVIPKNKVVIMFYNTLNNHHYKIITVTNILNDASLSIRSESEV